MPNKITPLPEILRPKILNDIIGQEKLLSQNGSIARILLKKPLTSFILWGPPGCGKTTLARVISKELNIVSFELSAVFSGVNDLRKIFEKAERNFSDEKQTILFVDEIHRFNKGQQDSFLPYIEKGIVTLIGATTENPSFSLISALLSRCQVVTLEKLDREYLKALKIKAEKHYNFLLPLREDTLDALVDMVDGDARYFLNLIEEIASLGPKHKQLEPKNLSLIFNSKSLNYDRNNEQHFNLISALHKSLRASDTDAALYWLARMLVSGEDPNYILRRLTRFANEDIGLSEPNAIIMAISTWQVYERLGSPEGDLSIAQLVIYLSTCPKSNSAYTAWKNVKGFVKKYPYASPPMSILNAPSKLMKDIGYGKGYVYDHNAVDAFSGQNCFPENINREIFYQPVERGYEREIKKRLDWWNKLRAKNAK